MAPDFGSSSRHAKGSILSICDFWRNAEDGPKGKQDFVFSYFRGPKSALAKMIAEIANRAATKKSVAAIPQV